MYPYFSSVFIYLISNTVTSDHRQRWAAFSTIEIMVVYRILWTCDILEQWLLLFFLCKPLLNGLIFWIARHKNVVTWTF